jgi:hypothetical protein
MNLKFLTAKDVSILTSSSISYSNLLINDIKKEYNLKTKITHQHLMNYLHL